MCVDFVMIINRSDVDVMVQESTFVFDAPISVFILGKLLPEARSAVARHASSSLLRGSVFFLFCFVE